MMMDQRLLKGRDTLVFSMKSASWRCKLRFAGRLTLTRLLLAAAGMLIVSERAWNVQTPSAMFDGQANDAESMIGALH